MTDEATKSEQANFYTELSPEGNFSIRGPVWHYEPQQDVTPYEAACLAGFFVSQGLSSNPNFDWLIRQCGETVMRHFRQAKG